MRVELEPGGAPGADPATPATPPTAAPRPRTPHPPAHTTGIATRARLDWFEALALVAFAVMSLWVVGLDLWQVVVHGRVWTGTDGVYIVDQMQYLAWIRDAAHHLLVSNLFVLRGTPADYFQPAIVLSGALVAAGVAPWLALLLWKPVAVLVSFWGVREFVRRSLGRRGDRRVALALALFFGSFSVIYGSPGVVGDLVLGFLSWGYTFGLLALGLMLLALLSYERLRTGRPSRRWAVAIPALLGCLASSLHPWNGELLIVIVAASELTLWRATRARPPSIRLLALTFAATALPLVYYAVLGQADISWHLARIASKHGFSIFTIALAMAPLVALALPAYFGRSKSFLTHATRCWPLAAVVIFLLSASAVSATPLHAFEGVTVPLSVLAVAGARRLRLARLPAARLAVALGVAALTVPSAVYLLHTAKGLVAPSTGNPNFITADEHRAIEYLARDPDDGGVLTRFYLGSVVPGLTGRRTFVGDCLWSEPQCGPRAELAEQIFDSALPAAATRRAVTDTGARFVLADCQAQPGLEKVLTPISADVRHFGCATVYELAAASVPARALAESAPDAALRATGRQQRGGQPS